MRAKQQSRKSARPQQAKAPLIKARIRMKPAGPDLHHATPAQILALQRTNETNPQAVVNHQRTLFVANQARKVLLG